MKGLQPGDIVATPTGRKWRVITVTRDIIRAETVDLIDGRRVVSHLDTTLTLLERHPGGAGKDHR